MRAYRTTCLEVLLGLTPLHLYIQGKEIRRTILVERVRWEAAQIEKD